MALHLSLAKNTEFSYKMTDYDYDSREQKYYLIAYYCNNIDVPLCGSLRT